MADFYISNLKIDGVNKVTLQRKTSGSFALTCDPMLVALSSFGKLVEGFLKLVPGNKIITISQESPVGYCTITSGHFQGTSLPDLMLHAIGQGEIQMTINGHSAVFEVYNDRELTPQEIYQSFRDSGYDLIQDPYQLLSYDFAIISDGVDVVDKESGHIVPVNPDIPEVVTLPDIVGTDAVMRIQAAQLHDTVLTVE